MTDVYKCQDAEERSVQSGGNQAYELLGKGRLLAAQSTFHAHVYLMTLA